MRLLTDLTDMATVTVWKSVVGKKTEKKKRKYQHIGLNNNMVMNEWANKQTHEQTNINVT